MAAADGDEFIPCLEHLLRVGRRSVPGAPTTRPNEFEGRPPTPLSSR
jgi:hypothetical protein